MTPTRDHGATPPDHGDPSRHLCACLCGLTHRTQSHTPDSTHNCPHTHLPSAISLTRPVYTQQRVGAVCIRGAPVRESALCLGGNDARHAPLASTPYPRALASHALCYTPPSRSAPSAPISSGVPPGVQASANLANLARPNTLLVQRVATTTAGRRPTQPAPPRLATDGTHRQGTRTRLRSALAHAPQSGGGGGRGASLRSLVAAEGRASRLRL